MEFTVVLEPLTTRTGGGTREVLSIITIDSNLDAHTQRRVLIYEALGSMLDYILSHDQLDEITYRLEDVLDQMEGERELTGRD